MSDQSNADAGRALEGQPNPGADTGVAPPAPCSAVRCPKCNGVGRYVRTRYFDTEEADVWECQSPLCVWHGLLWHTSRPVHHRCGHCGAPATAMIVELGEEADYGYACDSCKRHPAVARWRPLNPPNPEVYHGEVSRASTNQGA